MKPMKFVVVGRESVPLEFDCLLVLRKMQLSTSLSAHSPDCREGKSAVGTHPGFGSDRVSFPSSWHGVVFWIQDENYVDNTQRTVFTEQCLL